MKNKFYTYLILIVITLLGAFLRLVNITENPPSLNIDEISFGYSAYSILKTGKDEYGEFLPLTFRSTGDYKNPIPVYIVVPSIWLLGLTELAVRLPIALAGIFSIPVFFFLLRYLLKKNWLSLSGSFLLAVSAWHIHYSRFAYDPLLGSFFLLTGIYFFLRMLDGKKWAPIFSAFFLILSMYSAFTERFFVPIFILGAFILNYKTFWQNKKPSLIFITICAILVFPLLYLAIFSGANTRLGMIFLTQDIEYTRHVILDHLFSPGESLMLFYFWAERYLGYLDPNFLFFSGLNLTTAGTIGLGILYLFEIPLLLFGATRFIYQKLPHKKIIFLWLILGIFPASIANNVTSEGRSLLILPALLIILTIGLEDSMSRIKRLKTPLIRWGIIAALAATIVVNFIQAALIFSVHFPAEKGEAYMDGTKESVLYAIEHKNEYQEIVYDPYRGIEAAYIVNVPHLYILFYSKYDPLKFQSEVKNFKPDVAHFDKYTVRRIDWNLDFRKKGILFIGSPWNTPDDDTRKPKILKNIYLKSGQRALVIFTPQ